MACKFCMTGTLGLVRNLTAAEIVAQVHAVNREVARNEALDLTRPLTNLVFMGMGEPLHNFEHLKTALRILQSEEGPNFSHRHITASTVGLVPMIDRLGAETDVKLAVSLNASTDAQREAMMPVNKKWKIAELLEACRRFPLRQGRRITFEYVLLKGVNDADEDARRLVALLQGIPAKVNLIPYNENPGLGFSTTEEERAEAFRELLVGLDLDDVYLGGKSWSDLCSDAGLPVRPAGPKEEVLRRACGRLLHHRGGAGRGLPGPARRGPRRRVHPREPGEGHRRRLRAAGQSRGRNPADPR
jgi:adenine C2-methylase RlmN of 23S rRNA A2503 and tRNA A37